VKVFVADTDGAFQARAAVIGNVRSPSVVPRVDYQLSRKTPLLDECNVLYVVS